MIIPFKLVRDKLPDIIAKQGDKCYYKTLTGERYRDALMDKLVEEANEVRKARTRTHLIEEFADLHEVLNTLELSLIIHPHEIEEVRKAKFTKCGGFVKGIKLLFATGGRG